MTKVIITGAKGKMGQALVKCAQENPNLSLAGRVEKGQDLAAIIDQGDVVIDFSAHGATLPFAEICAKHKKAIVIGTTGHDESARVKLREIATRIPMVWSANFSTGVNALFWLTKKAAEILGPGFDFEIVEMHHRLKKDAPSGTAHALAEILATASAQQLKEVARYGREGITGVRTAKEIGIHSLRGGDVVGDNAVIFAGLGERLELAHKASSRDTFANGALRAAQWVQGKPAGIYDMQNVLGLK